MPAPASLRFLFREARTPAALLALLLGGCATAGFPGLAPRGTLLAEIHVTARSLEAPPAGAHGFSYYVEDDPGVAGPRLTGYRYANGKIVDRFGGGSESAAFVQAWHAIGLEPFDFEAEVRAAEARIQAAARNGERVLPPHVLDGSEYRLTFVTPHGRCELTRWNPGPTIDYYAAHSEKIARLKAALDLLAHYRGRLDLGI